MNFVGAPLFAAVPPVAAVAAVGDGFESQPDAISAIARSETLRNGVKIFIVLICLICKVGG